MTSIVSGPRAQGRWLTLGEAARILGVDATTLRGWADAGKIRIFRTPGGHRRFDAADLDAFLSASAAPPAPVPKIPATPGVPAGTARQWLSARPWYAGIPESGRVRVRGHCAELMQIVDAFVAGQPARPRHLAAGRRVGAALGREVAEWGLTPSQSTEVFLHFKTHVMEALAAPHGGGAGQLRSIRDADAFLGSVLQAMMEANEEARGGARRRPWSP